MADTRECDVAIIGAGTAGLAAERSARRAGAKTLLIDDKFAGTTCATVGCMPSKLLIAAGAAAQAVRDADTFGVAATPEIDGRAVMMRVRAMRDSFADATRDSIRDLPEGVAIKATARFVGPTELALDNGDRIVAKAVVIATGSSPAVPEPFAPLGDLILTNLSIFELEAPPESMAVIGAGSLGLELAQAMARLGVRVAVFDKVDRIAGLDDAAVSDALAEVLGREMPIRLGVDVEASRDGDEAVVAWSGKSQGEERFARVLLAVGRPPNLDTLDLAQAGIALDEDGVPSHEFATLQCGDAPIFLAGDVDAERPVLHEASKEGAIAGANAACFPKITPSERGPAFSIMFTHPPMAQVGKPASEESVVGAASYADQGRAKVEGKADGLVRIYAEPVEGRITGATLAAPGADHLGHLLAWAIACERTATELLTMPFYHPTYEEGLKDALRAICHAVHAPAPADQDEGSPPGA